MNFFSRLFGRKKVDKQETHSSPEESLPAIYGGDGLSKTSPAIINCASNRMAASLMNQFISEKHGVKDQDWTEQMALSLDSDITECGLIKAVIIEVNDETFTYYFDLSRPMRNPF